jgi:Holliday junction resolvasome RuvABC endonuclease subunit
VTIKAPGLSVADVQGGPAREARPGPAPWYARVVGIDPSLTSTGVAVVWRGVQGTLAATIATKGKRADTLVDRRNRIGHIVEKLGEYWGSADLVVVEGPAGATPGGSTWDRAGLWWAIVHSVMDYCSVAVVSPTTRAKWATGNGRADKAAVAVAMSRRAPDVDLSTSDEADALALAWMGAQWLGWRPVRSKVEQACLDAARWPEASRA